MAKTKKDDEDKGLYFTPEQMAKLLKVGKSSIYNWINEGAPHEKTGEKTTRINAPDFIEWYITNGDYDTTKKIGLQCLKLQLETDKMKTEARVREGSLMDIEVVRKTLADILTVTKSKLQHIPRKMAVQLQGQEATTIEELLSKEVFNALKGLTGHCAEMAQKENDNVQAL